MPWFELLVFFATPLAAAWIAQRPRMGWLDPVLTCYAVGLLLANLPISLDATATNTVAEAVVPLSIPLLLFRTDFVRWLQSSRATLVGFVVALCSALTSLLACTVLFRGASSDLWYVTGMLAGTWTGGSPNLVSVAAALDAPQEVMVLTNAADLVVGAVYLLALLTFARPLLAKWLPLPAEVEPMTSRDEEAIPPKKWVTDGAASLCTAALIVAANVGLSLLVFDAVSAPAVILGITTGGIVASFVPRIRALKASYEIGNYLILAFCTAIGALTDLSALVESGTTFLGFAAVALTMTLVIHFALCRLMRVDVDAAIITSVATIMGPALVVPVARRLDSQGALVSGIATGLVGYSVANFIGIAMANLAKAML